MAAEVYVACPYAVYGRAQVPGSPLEGDVAALLVLGLVCHAVFCEVLALDYESTQRVVNAPRDFANCCLCICWY